MTRADMQPVVITRAEAKARGLKRYYTGKPCKRGHVARRGLVDGACVECNRAHMAAYYAANPERVRARVAAYRAANPEKNAANSARRRARNPEKHAATQARRRARKRAALCTCCTSAQVRAVYARAVPGVHEVDHKLALALGGLHCVHNLEVLTVAEHRAKTTPDLRAVEAAKWLIKEQRAGRIPGDPAVTAAAFRMTVTP